MQDTRNQPEVGDECPGLFNVPEASIRSVARVTAAPNAVMTLTLLGNHNTISHLSSVKFEE
jgi:hypothetical protein